MADNKTTLENVMRECVKALGYEAAMELVNSMKPKAEEKPKKVEKVEKVEKKEEEKKKRIPRMSPTLAKDLVTELGKVGLKYSEDDKKEFEKIKKEFVAYVDNLSEDDYVSNNMNHHMQTFANSKKPAEEEKPKTEEKVVQVKAEEKPKRGRKPAVKKEEEKKEEAHEEKEMPAFSNAANVQDVSLEELRKIELIATPGDFKGVYWDGAGRWVRGPDADTDEDLVEMGFKKETFMVGEKTGRVYKESEDGGPDVLQGFVGVGQFREMKMP